MYTVIQDTHKHRHTQGKHKHRHTHTQGTHKTYIYRAAFNIIMNSFVYLPFLSRRCLGNSIQPSPPQVCRCMQHRVFYPYHSVETISAFFIELKINKYTNGLFFDFNLS